MRIRVSLRAYRPADLPRLMEIERSAFGRGAYSSSMFATLHHECGGLFFVAARARRVVGYMVTCVTGGTAEVASVAVEAQHRECGVGSALMERTLTESARLGVTNVKLTVRPGNGAAVAFYRKFGFRRVRAVKGYYEDGADGVLMKKELVDAGRDSSRTTSRRTQSR